MDSRAEKLEGLCEDLCDALAWILPLAKGYAAEHQVGSNSGLCIEAEDTLRKARAALALPADTPAQPAPEGAGEPVAWGVLLSCDAKTEREAREAAAFAQSVMGRMAQAWPLCPTPRAEAASAVPAWRDSFPPTHYCRECKALWRRWPDGSWSLVTMSCGKCCDNVPMGEQIVALGEACAAPASAEAVAREAADLLAEMDAAWPPSQPPPHPKSFQGRFQARVRAVANALRACKAGGA